jgi:hypothetical protein
LDGLHDEPRVRAIREGKSRQPTSETAVDLHRLVDAIKQGQITVAR